MEKSSYRIGERLIGYLNFCHFTSREERCDFKFYFKGFKSPCGRWTVYDGIIFLTHLSGTVRRGKDVELWSEAVVKTSGLTNENEFLV